jgi:catechol 2,3-dioxygenase-like lactoylglutathione lyase family enzyme
VIYGQHVLPGDLSLTNAVVGCSDLDACARFWEVLGFTESRSERVPADLATTLYGQRRPVETLAISVPGSIVGWIRLVEAGGLPRAWRPYLRGRSLLEFFTRALDDVVSTTTSAGAREAGRTEFRRAEKRNREVRLFGPDGVEIGLTESTANRPSLLDSGRNLSELTTMLWLVESVEAAFTDIPELEVYSDSSTEAWTPATEFLGLPDPSPAIRTAYLGEPGAPLERLQLLQLTGRQLETDVSWPIRPGMFAVGCESALAAPITVERSGGVRLEIWPRRSPG